MKEKYDIIIVGAGPAGLSAAISIKKISDLNILVLEKQANIGERKGGETLKYDKFLEKNLFYPGFFKEITVNATKNYRFHSPSTKHFSEIESTEERLIINWHKLIDELGKNLNQNGTTVKCNKEVVELIFKDNVYSGVVVADGTNYKSDLIILADGCKNPIINKYGVNTPVDVCPVLTLKAHNINLDGNYIELFFSNGVDIPPAVVAMFPRSETSVSTDYVQFVGSFKKDYSSLDIKSWWKKIRIDNPVLSERFKNAELEYCFTTSLPFGGPVIENIIPKERIFLVGNNAGHNEATGGSGLITSMKMGYEIGLINAEIHSSGKIEGNFSPGSKNQLIKRIQRTPIFRHLKKLKTVAVNLRNAFFKVLDTPEKVDEKWDSFLAPTLKNAAEFF